MTPTPFVQKCQEILAVILDRSQPEQVREAAKYELAAVIQQGHVTEPADFQRKAANDE